MKPSRTHWIARLTGAPASRWPDRGPWWARVRRWCLHTILRYDSESCDRCGGRVRLVWWATPSTYWVDVYERAAGNRPPVRDTVGAGLLCVRCFQRAASKLGRPAEVIVHPMPEDRL